MYQYKQFLKKKVNAWSYLLGKSESHYFFYYIFGEGDEIVLGYPWFEKPLFCFKQCAAVVSCTHSVVNV